MTFSDDEYVIVDNEIKEEVEESSSDSSDDSSCDSSSSSSVGEAVVPRRVRQIVLFEYKHNDPKRDSGMKLVRLGLARSLRPGDAFKGIVLSAEGRSVLSQADRALITSAGIAAINCSWNRLDEVKNIPGGNLGRHRKLPFLVASNPINYGKAYKLNSAEAIAAALAIVGFRAEAEKVTEKFSWNDEFWRVNEEYFAVYETCTDSKSMISAQNRFMYEKMGIVPETEEVISEKPKVRFSEAPPDVREFDKNKPIDSPPPVVVADPETVLSFPPEAPKDQKKCLVFLRDLSVGESLGIKKHASGNVLAKMKRKEYLEIWGKFTADAENLKFIRSLEAAVL